MSKIKKKPISKGNISAANPGTIHVANVTTKFNVEGISLSDDIEKHVQMIQGVKKIDIDYETEEVQVIYDANITNFDSIKKAIESRGHFQEEKPRTTHESNVTRKFIAQGISLSEDIEKHVRMIKGVKKIDIDYSTEEVQVIYDPNLTNLVSIKKAIESEGYICGEELEITPEKNVKNKIETKINNDEVTPVTKHVKKVIWAGSQAESISPDPRTTRVKNGKNKIETIINNGEGNPITTYVANVIKKFKATGMTCKNCEKVIEKQVKTMAGVKQVDIDYATEKVEVKYDPNKTNFNNIKKAIESKGYICEEYPATKSMSTTGWILLVLGIVVIAYYAIQSLEVIELPEISKDMSYGLLFIVGLLTGLHCVSMCGGFVVSYSTKGLAQGKKPHELHLAYGLGKTLSYTIIGAIFGLLGSIIAFTPLMRGVAGIFAGLFLMLFGLKMLNIFPVLRNIQFKTPEFISKYTHGQKKSHSDPLTIGLLNGLMIACGPLQAIYIMAAGTGSMLEGAKLLFVFALGTLPVMLSFGYITSFLGSKATHQILKFSGAIVIILGIFMINNGLALTGGGVDLNPTTDNGLKTIDTAPPSQQPVNVNTDYQEIRMEVSRAGFVPNKFDLKKGVPVKWIINGKEVTGCSNAIIVPSLGLEFKIKKGEQIIEFTPTKAGTIRWSCWMGMIQGSFNVK